MLLKIFNRKEMVWTPVLMVLIPLVLNIILRLLKAQPGIGETFNLWYLWPMSVFHFKRPDWQDLLTILGVGAVWLGFVKIWKDNVPIKNLILVSIILIIGSNLLQGYFDGFVSPVTGQSHYAVDYYHDVPRIQTVGHFLKTFTLFQYNLLDHSRVHPPGALLVFYFLVNIWNEPAFIGMVFLLLGSLSSWFIYDYLKTKIPEENAKLIAVTFLLLPAVQVFFLATLDAVICMLFVACLWAWDKCRGFDRWFLATLCLLWLSFFLTYGTLILVVPLILDDLRRNRSILLVFCLGLLLGVLYLGLFFFTGFNYVESLLIAKSFEGYGGFYLFQAPIEYLTTRTQDVLLVVIFLGPYLSLLLYKALRTIRWRSLHWKELPVAVTSVSILAAFVGFIIMGAYYTGETNRAALYLYPFMMILVGLYLGKKKLSMNDQVFLLSSTFFQAVLWQLFGFHAF